MQDDLKGRWVLILKLEIASQIISCLTFISNCITKVFGNNVFWVFQVHKKFSLLFKTKFCFIYESAGAI